MCMLTLWYFPIGKVYLLVALTFYVGLLYFKPFSWLIILPLITVGLSLTPWSGRFIANEHDLFVLLTIAMGLFRARTISKGPQGNMRLAIIFSAYCLFSLINVEFSAILKPLTQNLYFSNTYPFAVTKGVIFALGLVWVFKKQISLDKQTFITYLIIGATITSMLLFLIALWERRIISILFDTTPWMQVAHSFLNFTGAYRMTGIMADMHTGGESLDGMFLILAPINLLGVYWFKTQSGKAFALLGLLCLIYCVLVGFTRATYVSVALSLGALAALQFWWQFKNNKNDSQFPLIPLALYTLYSVSVFFAYSLAGYYTIAAGGIALLGALSIKHFKHLLRHGYWPALVMLNFVVVSICIDSFYDNAWVAKSTENLSMLVIAIIGMISSTMTINLIKQLSNTSSLYPHIAAIIVAAVLAIALGGTRIQMRMDATSKDLDTRLAHWQRVIDSSQWSITDILLGNGLGSFPVNYVTSQPDLVRRIGSFTLVLEGRQNSLMLGAGEDLAFGQRLTITPNTDYKIELQLKSYSASKKTKLFLSLCERNLLILERWAVKCETQLVKIEPSSQVQLISTAINSKNIGTNIGIKRLPTVLLLRYSRGTALLEIQSIKLLDQNLQSSIRNDNFEQGTDHWFFYHDFEHLPWHIKNIYLSIFYQLGVLGSLLFLALLLFAAKNLLTINDDGKVLNSTIASIILGYLAFGVFGDPLDSARISCLFFMLLFYLASISELKQA
jgi:hypothetical protein